MAHSENFEANFQPSKADVSQSEADKKRSMSSIIFDVNIRKDEIDDDPSIIGRFKDTRVIGLFKDSFDKMDPDNKKLLCAMDDVLTPEEIRILNERGGHLETLHDVKNNISLLYQLTEDPKYFPEEIIEEELPESRAGQELSH